jgi:hypothetical protein
VANTVKNKNKSYVLGTKRLVLTWGIYVSQYQISIPFGLTDISQGLSFLQKQIKIQSQSP